MKNKCIVPLLLLMAGAVLLLGAKILVTPSLNAEKENPKAGADTMLRSINPADSAIPGISQAVIVESGRIMYLSGHVPMTPAGQVLPPDLEAQLSQVFENLNTTLQAAGATSRNLVRITIYVRGFHVDQLPAIRRARDRFIDQGQPPASALIGVAELFHPSVLVEVDAVAVLPPDA